jgi:hypothetical protein
MTEAEHDEAIPHEDLAFAGANAERQSLDDHVTSLRGPAAASVGRTLWLFAGALGLVLFAIALVVSFISATNDNARIDRMKAHGIPVIVTVVDCIGNIGGSGSNAAGYTCRGDYTVGGTTYRELIGSMTTFSASGTPVRGVADPSQHSTVVLASAIRTSVASPKAYVPPGLFTTVLVALTLALLRVARRSEPPRRAPTAAARPQGR